MKREPSLSDIQASIRPIAVNGSPLADTYFRDLVLSIPASLYITDTEGTITLFNEPAAEMWGRRPEIGKDKWCGSWKIFRPEDGSEMSLDSCPMAVALRERRPVRGQEIIVERPDGTRRTVLPHPQPLRDSEGNMIGAINLLVDITERKALEGQLLHSQKMQAVGRLAGGVAHDFNNLLGVILGYAEITEMALPEDDPLRENLQQILQISKRAAGLTGQLLSFASKQVTNPKAININERVDFGLKMVKRIVGDNVELVLDLSTDAPIVHIDPSQFDQVLINLAVNAKDAMPNGGKLTIATATPPVSSQGGPEDGILIGGYVVLSVSDNGCGMSPDVLMRVFEPFFTTKEVGKGVGLGLSTCYGIANQAGGSMTIESVPDQGTTVRLYLPRAADLVEPVIALPKQIGQPTCHETILVVEDQPILLHLSATVLREVGFKVLAAANGPEAIAIASDYNGQIDLLITDIVMPEMSGIEVASLLRRARPEIKVLFISGYPNDVVGEQGIAFDDDTFLAKPFAPSVLVARARKLLQGDGIVATPLA